MDNITQYMDSTILSILQNIENVTVAKQNNTICIAVPKDTINEASALYMYQHGWNSSWTDQNPNIHIWYKRLH